MEIEKAMPVSYFFGLKLRIPSPGCLSDVNGKSFIFNVWCFCVNPSVGSSICDGCFFDPTLLAAKKRRKCFGKFKIYHNGNANYFRNRYSSLIRKSTAYRSMNKKINRSRTNNPVNPIEACYCGSH
jgi:hypothetical protein